MRPARARGPYRSGEALVVVDESLRISQWNAAAEALTGIPPSAAVGRRCWDVLGGRTEEGTAICRPFCAIASRGDATRLDLVVNTARCRRRVLMSTVICMTPAGTRVIHVLAPEDVPDAVDVSALTNREGEVLALLAEGLDVRAVALRLGISVTTVRTHVRHILSTLSVRSQAAAVAVARRGASAGS